MADLEFWFDFASPYAYLASTQMATLEADCNVTVQWRPFVLGKVFEATGNRPGVAVAAKGKHLMKDLSRWAKLYDVPVTMPECFPLHSILPERFALAAGEQGKTAEVAQAIMHAHWGEGKNPAEPDELKAIASDLGLDGDALLEQTQNPQIKQQLIDNTSEAIERGAFGAPTFFVGDEMFWGNDRIALLRDHIQSL